VARAFPSAVLAFALTLPGQALSAELVMMEQAGCAWCMRWDREIAPAYPRTAEGAIAPLRRVDIHGEWPQDLAGIAREPFTPTFVLVENGREIGRLRGYAGDQFFWPMLDELLSKLPQTQGDGEPAPQR